MINKIVFMGTPEFSVPLLKTCVQNSTVVGVFSQPDRKRGRGKKESPCPVRQAALDLKLPTFTTTDKAEIETELRALNPDLIIVVAYGVILPKPVTDRFFCINIHASILPLYRGASPIQAAILNQDTQTGITLIKMDEKMDEGDIIKIDTLPLNPETNCGDLHDSLCELACSQLNTFLQSTSSIETITHIPQPTEGVSYCKKITKEDLKFNASATIQNQLAQIKAFSPLPGAYTESGDKRIKLINATIEAGKLKLTQVKPEGKGTMPYADYLKGNPPIDFSLED